MLSEPVKSAETYEKIIAAQTKEYLGHIDRYEKRIAELEEENQLIRRVNDEQFFMVRELREALAKKGQT